jgi:PAS domain S-box-containing protein
MLFIRNNECGMAATGGCSDDQMFRTIVDTSFDGIGISTFPDLRFVYVNEAFARMTGVARAPLIGRLATEFDFVADKRGYDRTRLRLERDGAIRYKTFELQTKDGARANVRISAVIVEQDGERRVVWMLHDITLSSRKLRRAYGSRLLSVR